MPAKVPMITALPEGGIIRRALPMGLARIAAMLTGKRILIVGPSSAGKTKFAQYLRLGLLDQESKREMTYAVTEWPTFAIQLPGNPGLLLNIRRAVDTPGQVGPVQQASLVGSHKPHLLIIVLDCTRTVANTSQWLTLFCNRLDTVLRFGRSARRRLDRIMVLLNKRDKVGGRKPAQLTQATRQILAQHLSVVLSTSRVEAVPVLECVAVQSPLGTTLIDQVIAELVKQLSRLP